MKKSEKACPIAIVLPAYNEAGIIGSVLKTVPSEINGHKVVIIVVNDGSSDNTSQVVGNTKNVRLINHLLNFGAGAATRTGLNYANRIGCRYAVTMDSDGQHSTADVIKIAEAVINNEADFVIGSRLMQSKGMPRHRIVGNRGLSLITLLLFGVFVTDSQSGLRGFNNVALQKIKFRSNHYDFCSEMIWRAKKAKLRIKEVPIQAIYTEYSRGKGQSSLNGFNIVGQLIKRRIMEIVNE